MQCVYKNGNETTCRTEKSRIRIGSMVFSLSEAEHPVLGGDPRLNDVDWAQAIQTQALRTLPFKS